MVVLATLAMPLRPAAAEATFNQRMLELVNQARSANGLKPLVADAALGATAEDAPYTGCGFPVAGRAKDMGQRNYFSHTILGCGTQSVFNILDSLVQVISGAGENIAWLNGTTDPLVAAENLHNQLMNSPGHRANVLSPDFTKVGIGSWRTSPGQTWTGGGFPLPNVWIGVQIFAGGPVDPGTTTTTTPPPTAGGGRFHPLVPSRLLDTRTGNGSPVGPLGAGTMNLQVTGRGGVPSTGVSAVVLNVAVTGATAQSYLIAFPAGQTAPLASNLNFGPGQTLSNMVTAKVGANGQISLYNAAGAADVIADVAGWYDTGNDSSGGGYHALTPNRILDTRSGTGAPAGALGTGTMNVQVTGRGGVPSTGVSAVVLNVAVTGATAPSYLTAFPTGQPMPVAANLTYGPGQTLSNMVTAKVGANGQISLYNAAGATDVIADVAGWYDTGNDPTGSRFYPLTASRVLDTRTGTGAPLAPLGTGTLNVQLTGRGGVPSTGVSAVVLNIAVTGATAPSYLTAFPTGQPMPLAANLNFGPGQTVSNLATARLGADGRLAIFNAAGSTHVIADVAGWFSP